MPREVKRGCVGRGAHPPDPKGPGGARFAMRCEEARTPKMPLAGPHQRLTGHPARTAGPPQPSDRVGRRRDVRTTRRIDVARHRIETRPRSGGGLNK